MGSTCLQNNEDKLNAQRALKHCITITDDWINLQVKCNHDLYKQAWKPSAKSYCVDTSQLSACVFQAEICMITIAVTCYKLKKNGLYVPAYIVCAILG